MIVDIGTIEINDFLEDANFVIKVSLLFVEDISLVLEILDGSGVLSDEDSFFTSALVNIGLVSSNFSFEFNDFLLDLDEISLVDLDLLFELKFEIGGSNVRSDLVFLSLSNLSLDGGFKTVKYFEEFLLDLRPSLSGAILEVVKSKICLVVINVTRADFVS